MTVCDVCGGDQFSAHDGFYFCDECHTQSQDIRDLATDDDFVQTGMSSRNFVISDATRAKRQRQKERKAKQRVARIKITPKEVLNLLLHRWSAALVARGAPAQLTEATAQLWEVVLRSGRANTRMFRGVTAAVMLLWLALVDCEPLCRLSDVFRWSRQGVLPVLTARNEMPEDVSTDRCNTFVVGKLMNMAKIREQLSSMVNKLGLPPPPQPSLHRLLRRLLDELVLPTQLADVVTNVARLGSPPDTYMPEASALAMLLITLKMLLGLDDATEVRNSEVAKARNDAIVDGPRWFVFTEWLAFMRELRAEASEQDYVELDTADRELETMPGLDYCRHHHRQLLFDYVRREGTFRALEKVSTFQNYNSAEYRLQLMKLFGRVLTPQMPPPPSESDDLLRPVASRLEHHGGELLRRANEFRQSRVDYLLDDSHVRALKAEGVAVAVTLTAARQRIPSEVSILRPSQTEGVRAWSRDIVLVDDPDEAGDMQRRIRERHPAPWRRPPLDDLRLFRPFDEIWRLPQAWMGVPPYRPDYMTEAGALPINYRCLLELLAASIDVVPFHFLRDVVRAEAAVVGMEFLVFNARARREGMDPKVLRFRAKRNKGYYKHWKRKVAKKRTSEGAEPDSKEAEPDSEGIAPTSESRPGDPKRPRKRKKGTKKSTSKRAKPNSEGAGPSCEEQRQGSEAVELGSDTGQDSARCPSKKKKKKEVTKKTASDRGGSSCEKGGPSSEEAVLSSEARLGNARYPSRKRGKSSSDASGLIHESVGLSSDKAKPIFEGAGQGSEPRSPGARRSRESKRVVGKMASEELEGSSEEAVPYWKELVRSCEVVLNREEAGLYLTEVRPSHGAVAEDVGYPKKKKKATLKKARSRRDDDSVQHTATASPESFDD